jgi:hypothetical protein
MGKIMTPKFHGTAVVHERAMIYGHAEVSEGDGQPHKRDYSFAAREALLTLGEIIARALVVTGIWLQIYMLCSYCNP